MKYENSTLPTVSVIVPMYKVENYIAKCINSISNQCFKNIEIILINDGSPDNSGLIAEELSVEDNRIQVIHTENKGVSEARNLGIEVATGEFITFVDGDDYLSSDYVAYMLSIINKTEANFVLSKNCFIFPGNNSQVSRDRIEIFSSEEAATALLYPGKIEIGCWNKMFNRKFLLSNGVRFSENFYMGEGLKFIVYAAQLSDFVGVGRKKVYHYRKDNPTSATTVVNIPKYINALDAIDSIAKNASFSSVEFNMALQYHEYMTVFASLQAMLRTDQVVEYRYEYEEYVSKIRNGAFRLFVADIPVKTKIRIWMYCITPKLSDKLIKWLRKVNNKRLGKY